MDTSAWLAVVSAREAGHAAAMDAYRAVLRDGARLVTSNLVVAEMQVLVTRERGSAAGVGFLDRLYADPAHEVRFVDRELEARAIDRWLRPFGDHAFSLADATSFEIMRTEGLGVALAFDRHFEIAGFETVPAVGQGKKRAR